MTSTRFVLAYNVSELSVDQNIVLAFVKSNKYVLQWAMLYPGLILIKSNGSAYELTRSFNDILAPADYIFIRASSTDPADLDGLLQQGVWDWLSVTNTDDTQVLEVK